MAGVTIILWIYLCMLAFLLAIPVMIGIYVYKDASRRSMNAVLWTFIAVMAPVFVGFIIYLLVRGSDPEYICPSCQAEVKSSYTVCPKCGTRLQRVCASCGFPLEGGWKVCPRCAAPVEEMDREVHPPVRKKDKGLVRILAAAILIPVICLLLLMVLGISTHGGGASSMKSTSYHEEEAEQCKTACPKIWAWMEECKAQDPEGVYVLRHQAERFRMPYVSLKDI